MYEVREHMELKHKLLLEFNELGGKPSDLEKKLDKILDSHKVVGKEIKKLDLAKEYLQQKASRIKFSLEERDFPFKDATSENRNPLKFGKKKEYN